MIVSSGISQVRCCWIIFLKPKQIYHNVWLINALSVSKIKFHFSFCVHEHLSTRGSGFRARKLTVFAPIHAKHQGITTVGFSTVMYTFQEEEYKCKNKINTCHFESKQKKNVKEFFNFSAMYHKDLWEKKPHQANCRRKSVIIQWQREHYWRKMRICKSEFLKRNIASWERGWNWKTCVSTSEKGLKETTKN